MAASADRRPKSSLLWMQGLACGALLTFAAPTALVLGVLMAPALACLAGDRSGAHGAARAVALCCFAACLSPLWHLWFAGQTLSAALQLLTEPQTLIFAWGGGACAWALCQVIPVLLRAGWDAQEARRGRLIEAEITQTLEDWDLQDM